MSERSAPGPARDLDTGRHRQIGRYGVTVGPHQHLEEVDTRRMDADENLTRPRLGDRQFYDLENTGRTEASELDGFHGR